MTTAPQTSTPQNLDRVVRDVAGDSMADFVLKMDKRQSVPATAKVCPSILKGKNAGHGTLGVSGDGQWLICGKCEHREGISRGEIEHLEKLEQEHIGRLAASVMEAANRAEASNEAHG